MRGEPERPTPPSAAELAHADDETVEALVFEYASEVLNQAPRNPFSAFKSLPNGVQFVYATKLLEGEVNNGGFNQYFFNSSSDYSLEALRGYQCFGAVEHARILRMAIEVFHEERWFHHRIRLRRSLESFFESYQYTRLGEVDSMFYELEDDIAERRAAYIRAHLDQFAT